jgi:hypothetical protein
MPNPNPQPIDDEESEWEDENEIQLTGDFGDPTIDRDMELLRIHGNEIIDAHNNSFATEHQSESEEENNEDDEEENNENIPTDASNTLIRFTINTDNINNQSSWPNNIGSLVWDIHAPFRTSSKFDNITEFVMMSNQNINDIVTCKKLQSVKLVGDYNMNVLLSEQLTNVIELTLGENYKQSFAILSNFPFIQHLHIGAYVTLGNPNQTIESLLPYEHLQTVAINTGFIMHYELYKFHGRNIKFHINEIYDLFDSASRPPYYVIPVEELEQIVHYLEDEHKSDEIGNAYYMTPVTEENQNVIENIDKLLKIRGIWTHKEIDNIKSTKYPTLHIGLPNNPKFTKTSLPYLPNLADIQNTDFVNTIETFNELLFTSNQLDEQISAGNMEYANVMNLLRINQNKGLNSGIDTFQYRETILNELKTKFTNFVDPSMMEIINLLNNTIEKMRILEESVNVAFDVANEQKENAYNYNISCSIYTTNILRLEMTQRAYNHWLPIFKIRSETTKLFIHEMLALDTEVKSIRTRRATERNRTIRSTSTQINKKII